MLSIGIEREPRRAFRLCPIGGNVGAIRVEGNKRVEPETVKTYLTFNVGDPYDLRKSTNP